MCTIPLSLFEHRLWRGVHQEPCVVGANVQSYSKTWRNNNWLISIPVTHLFAFVLRQHMNYGDVSICNSLSSLILLTVCHCTNVFLPNTGNIVLILGICVFPSVNTSWLLTAAANMPTIVKGHCRSASSSDASAHTMRLHDRLGLMAFWTPREHLPNPIHVICLQVLWSWWQRARRGAAKGL